MSQQQSSVLASRIAAKRAELDNLRQLRDMSAALALQMQALQDKLGTLKDGTEGLSIFIILVEYALINLYVGFSCCLCSCKLG